MDSQTTKEGECMKSILQPAEPRQCYLCGRQYGLQTHHVMSGTANRRLSERFGLTLVLCAQCHTGDGGAQYERELNTRLRREAQEAFEKIYNHDLWMHYFKKNYL